MQIHWTILDSHGLHCALLAKLPDDLKDFGIKDLGVKIDITKAQHPLGGSHIAENLFRIKTFWMEIIGRGFQDEGWGDRERSFVLYEMIDIHDRNIDRIVDRSHGIGCKI